MFRRIFFFSIGVLISILFLSIGPENRLKTTFYAYIDYFNVDKRVISHLMNDNIIFSHIADCQLVYYNIDKKELLSVLDNGKVNFKLSDKNSTPCQYYVVENKLSGDFISVKFEYCYSENTVRLLSFIMNSEKEVCVY